MVTSVHMLIYKSRYMTRQTRPPSDRICSAPTLHWNIDVLISTHDLIACGTIVGTTFGLIASYYGGLTDEIVMRVTDVFTALPYIIIALSIAVVTGQSFWVIALVPALASCPAYCAWREAILSRYETSTTPLRLHP